MKKIITQNNIEKMKNMSEEMQTVRSLMNANKVEGKFDTSKLLRIPEVLTPVTQTSLKQEAIEVKMKDLLADSTTLRDQFK
mmetsp:Transcript_1408/g.1358  ORF Transcript_1408/g.1358 Transcript_1408/m.1358 type:complete len:81 (+) Transcript_1408:371-613(+)